MKCPRCSKEGELTVIDTMESTYYACHYDDGGCGYITFEEKEEDKK